MKKFIGSNVNLFLGVQSQLKILHWQAKQYSSHMAFGSTYDDLDDLIDAFIEGYMGKYGRFELDDEEKTIELANMEEMDIEGFIHTMKDALNQIGEQLEDSDTDLLNIRDEMLSIFNKLSYLLTLE